MITGSRLVGGRRLALYLGWTLVCLPIQMVALSLGWRLSVTLPRFYHRICLRLFGLELQQIGAPASVRPVLFVSNHSSYLDIVVLGAVLEASFIAKTEVAAWPFFGLLARMQRTVFVDRRRPGTTGQQRDELTERLRAGGNLILFPEGTSSDGSRTLPFKSALFGAAAPVDGKQITVQPVSVTATHLDGIPLGHELRPLYAWYGDMTLPPHLWTMLQAGRIRVAVEFHPPVTLADFANRKALADHCWRAVAGGVQRQVTGRP
jgi:1-acyl-sn-glycerol-3-phosphate acyltransferase